MQNSFSRFPARVFLSRVAPLVLMVFGVAQIHAQNAGTIRGSVTDPSASVVPGATVQILGSGFSRTAKSDGQGKFTMTVPSGTYSVRADAKGFTTFTAQSVAVSNGQVTPLDIALQVAAEAVQVQVQEDAVGVVTTDPSQNVGALVLKTEDLEFLPDDPTDLEADLQALAGPAAGPNGAQFFVDGFSGGQLPPKSSIREIRINSNPFSSEFDRPGFGRIEILTKPGTDKFHGGGFANFSDKNFDSRNPFLTTNTRPHYSAQMFSFNIGGPINKKSSFFLDFNNRNSSDQALINATALDPTNFTNRLVSQAFPVPAKNYSISPRLDYQINSSNTIVARYNFLHATNTGGVSTFALPSQATQNSSNNHNIQITETAILGTRAIDETRLQISRRSNDSTGTGLTGPVINVQGSFTDFGSPVIANFTDTNGIEVQNTVTTTLGRQTIKAGVRFRYDTLANNSTSNYNGTYTFTNPNSLSLAAPCLASYVNAGVKPTSIDVYRETQRLISQNVPMSTIIANGCGPTSFTLNAGTPLASVNQFDAGLFVQDDFRLRPNLTVSGGLRYEAQTNISDKRAIAPRIAIAWSPDSKGGRQGKTVIRTGYGIFYDRFSENNYLNTLRYNGDPNSQQNYNINITQNPTLAAPALAAYPNKPSLQLLQAQNQALYKVDRNYVAPGMLQFSASVDRSLPGRTSVSVNFVDTRGIHDQRTRNINAYVPGSYNPLTRLGGVRPLAGGDLYLYESSGIYKQRQFIVNMSTRFNRHFTMQGYYANGHVNSNVNGFPSNQYDTSVDYGRAAYDIRHRVSLSGNVGLPFKMSIAPNVSFNSAPPFNITTGTDYNGDGINNDRPSFATSKSDPKNVVASRWGTFNGAPLPGETIIPINYGTGYSNFTVNARLSRSWGWGERAGAAPADGMDGGGPGRGGPPPGAGGPRGGGGGGPRGGGGFAGVGRGGFGGFGGGGTGKKYSVTFTLAARNAFNHVNLAAPQGALTSPNFGNAISTGGDGGGRGGGGGGGATANRRVELSLRFSF
ncbi:MAG: Cna protein B-type domain protein [Bryobacterales bacterium]|nr:Cna protein B-type domain protein [Bryobacterales bacterium]